MTRSAQLDWLAIQHDWVNNEKSVREIGKTHGVSHTRIAQRAKAEAWPERSNGGGVPPRRVTGKLPTRGKLPGSDKLPHGGKQPASASAKFPIVVREWPKKGELARVTVDTYKGATTVNLRLWYQKDGEWKPGPKGFVIGAASWPALAAEVTEVLTREGLLDTEEPKS
jgi:hypothetical protein